MMNFIIATPPDGDTEREVLRALNALARFQISEAAAVVQPSGDVKLQVPDARAEEACRALRDARIAVTRVR
jgi:hypothetical protein